MPQNQFLKYYNSLEQKQLKMTQTDKAKSKNASIKKSEPAVVQAKNEKELTGAGFAVKIAVASVVFFLLQTLAHR